MIITHLIYITNSSEQETSISTINSSIVCPKQRRKRSLICLVYPKED